MFKFFYPILHKTGMVNKFYNIMYRVCQKKIEHAKQNKF